MEVGRKVCDGVMDMQVPTIISRFDLPNRRRLFRRAKGLGDKEVVAIGDIHGRHDLLAALLHRLDIELGEDRTGGRRLIVLGDFIDRGPDSRKVIDILRRGSEASPRIKVLLGNHEALLLDAVAGDATAQRQWMKYGGVATLASYGLEPPRDGEAGAAFAFRLADRLGEDLIEWLRDLPLSVAYGDYFFCHAGIKPGVPLDRQARSDLLWIRNAFTGDGRDHGGIIVHGHSEVDAVELRPNRINLDTGAYRSGRLSAVVLTQRGGMIISTEGEAMPDSTGLPISAAD